MQHLLKLETFIFSPQLTVFSLSANQVQWLNFDTTWQLLNYYQVLPRPPEQIPIYTLLTEHLAIQAASLPSFLLISFLSVADRVPRVFGRYSLCLPFPHVMHQRQMNRWRALVTISWKPRRNVGTERCSKAAVIQVEATRGGAKWTLLLPRDTFFFLFFTEKEEKTDKTLMLTLAWRARSFIALLLSPHLVSVRHHCYRGSCFAE